MQKLLKELGGGEAAQRLNRWQSQLKFSQLTIVIRDESKRIIAQGSGKSATPY